MTSIVYERELPCFLAWPRRNPIPAHPNIHTDDDAAQAAGFKKVIMSSSQLVAHIHQALVDLFGIERYYGGVTLSYKMVSPLEVPGIARVVVESIEGSSELAVRIEDENGKPCIVGSAALAFKEK